jgi:hypothetical protein
MWKTNLKNVNKLGRKTLELRSGENLSFYKPNYQQENFHEFSLKFLFENIYSLVHSFNTPNSSNKFYI